MHQIHKFILSWNSTCFGQFVCPSSGVYSLYTQQWYMSYSSRAGPSWFCSTAVYKPVWHLPLFSVHCINSWWWTEELSETCRVSRQNKFVKLVHLVGFIIKKFVTMHGHTNVKFYPEPPPANFYNPLSLRLPSPLRSILISIGDVLVDLKGNPLCNASCRRRGVRPASFPWGLVTIYICFTGWGCVAPRPTPNLEGQSKYISCF